MYKNVSIPTSEAHKLMNPIAKRYAKRWRKMLLKTPYENIRILIINSILISEDFESCTKLNDVFFRPIINKVGFILEEDIVEAEKARITNFSASPSEILNEKEMKSVCSDGDPLEPKGIIYSLGGDIVSLKGDTSKEAYQYILNNILTEEERDRVQTSISRCFAFLVNFRIIKGVSVKDD